MLLSREHWQKFLVNSSPEDENVKKIRHQEKTLYDEGSRLFNFWILPILDSFLESRGTHHFFLNVKTYLKSSNLTSTAVIRAVDRITFSNVNGKFRPLRQYGLSSSLVP